MHASLQGTDDSNWRGIGCFYENKLANKGVIVISIAPHRIPCAFFVMIAAPIAGVRSRFVVSSVTKRENLASLKFEYDTTISCPGNHGTREHRHQSTRAPDQSRAGAPEHQREQREKREQREQREHQSTSTRAPHRTRAESTREHQREQQPDDDRTTTGPEA